MSTNQTSTFTTDLPSVMPPRVRSAKGRVALSLSVIWLAALVLFTVTYQWWGLPDATESDYTAVGVGPFSPGHLLGTDPIGRDMLARLVVGAPRTTANGGACALSRRPPWAAARTSRS